MCVINKAGIIDVTDPKISKSNDVHTVLQGNGGKMRRRNATNSSEQGGVVLILIRCVGLCFGRMGPKRMSLGERSLKERMEEFLLDERSHDVTFLVGPVTSGQLLLRGLRIPGAAEIRRQLALSLDGFRMLSHHVLWRSRGLRDR